MRGLGDGPHRIHTGDRVVHTVIQTTDAGRLYIFFDATRNEEFVYRFGRYLVATGLLIVAIGWLLSVWLAWIVVSPIRRLAERLAQWSPGSTTRSVSESDEEALLLQAFDQAQRKLDEAIAHEREFAANVRHEVRTPLSALRTDAEMLLLTTTLEPPARDRLRRMIETVDAVADSVESTWSLSTAEPARPETLDLAACVDSAWASLQHLNADDRMRLHNLLAANEQPELDRQALMTILRNLLRNAIEHASPGTCEVRRTPSGIEIADDGPGIGADDLPHVFDRYFRGRRADSVRATSASAAVVTDPVWSTPDAARPPDARSGRGLGLAIARQAALQQGWLLTVRSGGSGTVFRLDFQN
jgi:signal transduction histidine kinase